MSLHLTERWGSNGLLHMLSCSHSMFDCHLEMSTHMHMRPASGRRMRLFVMTNVDARGHRIPTPRTCQNALLCKHCWNRVFRSDIVTLVPETMGVGGGISLRHAKVKTTDQNNHHCEHYAFLCASI